MASLSPRRSRMRSGLALSRSSPSKWISPAVMRPGGCGTSPMMLSAVTLLPQPDSPTMPRVRPRSSVKSMPSTARTSPSSDAKCVRRFLTSSRLLVTGDLLLDHAAIQLARGPLAAGGALEVRDEALVRLFVQALQLGQRRGVVIDAQIELGVVLGRAEQERRRLLAALVAAGGLAGLQRGEQPLRERQVGGLLVDARRFAHYLRPGEHVAGHRVATPGDGAAPVDALLAGVLADAPARVHHMHLALLAAVVGGDQAPHHLGGRQALDRKSTRLNSSH